ncbi:MAG TPA: HU family DNA-binding protein [Gemmataceae bacterium]|nr:HU family DNA-binding protein [Gemmataceae bacterium]
MHKRPWLALAALAGTLGGFVAIEAPAQSQKPRAEETLGQRVARESKLSEDQVARVLKALGPAIRAELTKGNTVSLPGFGTFRVVRVAEHKDMEAGTGRVLRVPAKNTVEFLAGEGLAEAANSATAKPAETVPAFEQVPLKQWDGNGGREPGQKVGPTRSEGIRTR